MIVFYDPNNGKQVMAVYSHDTESKVWESRGFLRAEVEDPQLQQLINRDSTVDVLDGKVISIFARVNSVQPTISASAARAGELESKLATSELNIAELNELARLERRL